MRELALLHNNVATRVEKLERAHDRLASVHKSLVEDIERRADAMMEMKALPPVKKRKIGFRLGDDD